MPMDSKRKSLAVGAVKSDPKDPSNWYFLGQMLQQEGEKDKAKDCYERAVSIDPLYSVAHQALRELESKPVVMMSAYNYKRVAYSLNEANLLALEAIFTQLAHSVSYTARFSDGTSVCLPLAEEIIKLPNSGSRRLTSLMVATQREWRSNENYLKMEFNNSVVARGSIVYDIEAEQQKFDYIVRRVEDEVHRMKQWYSPITMLWSNVIFLLLATALSVFVLVYRTAPSYTSISLGSSEDLLSLLVPIGAGIAFAVLINYLFPVAVFEIGEGVNRHKRRTMVQSLIFLTVVAGILVNIVSSYLYSIFTQ